MRNLSRSLHLPRIEDLVQEKEQALNKIHDVEVRLLNEKEAIRERCATTIIERYKAAQVPFDKCDHPVRRQWDVGGLMEERCGYCEKIVY